MQDLALIIELLIAAFIGTVAYLWGKSDGRKAERKAIRDYKEIKGS